MLLMLMMVGGGYCDLPLASSYSGGVRGGQGITVLGVVDVVVVVFVVVHIVTVGHN